MKKLILAFALTMTTLPAFAQAYSCQVVAVDRFNRVLLRFNARPDWQTGMCRDGLRMCNMEIRRRGMWDARCLQVRGRGW